MTPSLFDAYVPPEQGYAGTWIGRVWVPDLWQVLESPWFGPTVSST